MNQMSDRTVLVTGGGRGLGRSHALALAARGANVLVNDTGAELSGAAGDGSVAQSVVDEIVAAGGNAASCTCDIGTHEGAIHAVEAALDAFGTVDAVVNNAGILRDRSFAKMTFEDFDEVIRVHLAGAMYVTKAAWKSLVASGSGRVVFTSSAGGLYGSFGQANYGAAKMGLIGMMNVLRQEAVRSGVGVNAIAPIATTRMTEPLLPTEVHQGLAPSRVSDLVAYLCSPVCSQQGLVLEVGAGVVARVRVGETSAHILPPSQSDEGMGALLAALVEADEFEEFTSSPHALERILKLAAERS